MGEQQAIVIALPRADQFAVPEHRFLHPVERAFAQHRPGMARGHDQRRIPHLGQHGIAPPRLVRGVARDPRHGAGVADIAAFRQDLGKAHPPRRSKAIGGGPVRHR